MKKRIIALLLCLIMTLSLFSGCGLLTENTAKTQDNTVITIGSGEFAQTITKNEIINSFYPYLIYVQYYGVSIADVMDTVVQNLIYNKVAIIYALENLPVVQDRGDDVYGSYLTDSELAEIEDRVDKLISGEIDKVEVSAIQAEIEGYKAPTYRATPSSFTYLSSVPMDFVDTDTRNSAYKQFLRNISGSGLDMETFRANEVQNQKSMAIFNKAIEVYSEQNEVSDADVQARFNSMLEKQMENYAVDDGAYMDLLTAVQNAKSFSGENFVIYAPEANYGFGYNLLLGFNEEQSAQIKAWLEEVKEETMTEAEFEQKRAELATQITVKDLRTDWLKQYGANTELFEDFAFDGKYEATLTNGVQTRDENGEFAYSTLNANEYTVDEFMAKLNTALNATATGAVDGFDMYVANQAMKETFQNFVWAYSTDGGSLGTDVGYAFSSDPEKTSMVDEYELATTALSQTNVGTYTSVVTDFGIHIIFVSELYKETGVINQFNASEKNVEGTFSNQFYNDAISSINTARYSAIVSAYTNEQVAKEDFLVYNQDKYAEVYTEIQSLLSK